MDFHIQIPSARRNINEELREAILGLKRERAKELLADGADINHAVNKDRDTMLHHATTPYQVYCILGHGADVNACNIQGKTPLHSAAETGKCVEVIEALISHCADVNARDKCGNLPLNYAVRRIEKDYKVIKELVMKGSFVMHHRNAFDLNYLTCPTPLRDAVLMDDIQCVRALIKYLVLQRLPVAPDPNAFVEYCRHRRYNSMTNFYNKCCFHQRKMEIEVVHKQSCTTLLKVIQRCFSLDNVVGKEEKAIDSFANRCLWLVRSLKYSVYNDVILSKLEELLDHRCIMNQVRELEIYTCVNRISPCVDKKNSDGNNYNKVTINADRQKCLGYLDKKPNSCPVPKKWETESYQRAVLNPDFQLRVDAHKNVCMKFNSGTHNACGLTVDFQPQDISIWCHKIADQPQSFILNENLNLKDAYDIGAGFNENVDLPQKYILNEKRDSSRDLRQDLEKVADSQNVKSRDNKEERVVLNGDLVATITGYLGKRDLFNLFVAYYVPVDIPQVDEEEGSMDWIRKRILKRVAERPSSHPHKVAKFC